MSWPTDVDMASIGRTVLVNPATGQPWSANGIPTSPVPAGATVVNTGTIAAIAAMAAVLPAASGVTNYLSGFSVTGLGASTAIAALVTVTGVLGGTMPYYFPVPAGAVTGATPLVVNFNPALPAAGASLNVQVNVASFGSGNTAAAVNAFGYKI